MKGSINSSIKWVWKRTKVSLMNALNGKIENVVGYCFICTASYLW
jgi:hypothetical protein